MSSRIRMNSSSIRLFVKEFIAIIGNNCRQIIFFTFITIIIIFAILFLISSFVNIKGWDVKGINIPNPSYTSPTPDLNYLSVVKSNEDLYENLKPEIRNGLNALKIRLIDVGKNKDYTERLVGIWQLRYEFWRDIPRRYVKFDCNLLNTKIDECKKLISNTAILVATSHNLYQSTLEARPELLNQIKIWSIDFEKSLKIVYEAIQY